MYSAVDEVTSRRLVVDATEATTCDSWMGLVLASGFQAPPDALSHVQVSTMFGFSEYSPFFTFSPFVLCERSSVASMSFDRDIEIKYRKQALSLVAAAVGVDVPPSFAVDDHSSVVPRSQTHHLFFKSSDPSPSTDQQALFLCALEIACDSADSSADLSSIDLNSKVRLVAAPCVCERERERVSLSLSIIPFALLSRSSMQLYCFCTRLPCSRFSLLLLCETRTCIDLRNLA